MIEMIDNEVTDTGGEDGMRRMATALQALLRKREEWRLREGIALQQEERQRMAQASWPKAWWAKPTVEHEMKLPFTSAQKAALGAIGIATTSPQQQPQAMATTPTTDMEDDVRTTLEAHTDEWQAIAYKFLNACGMTLSKADQILRKKR